MSTSAPPTSEKARAYELIDKLRTQSRHQAHKIAALRREIKALRRATDAKENAALRREAAQYKQALSNILHRLDTADGVPAITDATLREIVTAALKLYGLKPHQRKEIHSIHDRAPKPGARA